MSTLVMEGGDKLNHPYEKIKPMLIRLLQNTPDIIQVIEMAKKDEPFADSIKMRAEEILKTTWVHGNVNPDDTKLAIYLYILARVNFTKYLPLFQSITLRVREDIPESKLIAFYFIAHRKALVEYITSLIEEIIEV